MNRKSIAIAVIVGIALLVGVAMRAANRADAAGSDCFSDSDGPSTPTVCN